MRIAAQYDPPWLRVCRPAAPSLVETASISARINIGPLKRNYRRQLLHKPLVSVADEYPCVPKRIGSGIDLLADPTRRRIVALLALGVGRPSKLAQEIGLSRPATSRQLRILVDGGLVTSRRGWADRRKVVYLIEPRRLGQITAWLAGTEVGRAFAEVPDRRGRSA